MRSSSPTTRGGRAGPDDRSFMRWIAKRVLLAAALATCVAASGCGDDETSAGESGTPGDLARGLARAVQEADCPRLRRINRESGVRVPCPKSAAQSRWMDGFEIVGAEAWGTGAVVDYKARSARDGASMVMFLNTRGKWGLSQVGLVNAPSVGTDDEPSRTGFDQAVGRYLLAIRKRDCDIFFRYAVTFSPDTKAACRREFQAARVLTRSLGRNLGTKPAYLGGNARFGFYGLTLAKPKRHFTISVVKADPRAAVPYLVLGIARSAEPALS